MWHNVTSHYSPKRSVNVRIHTCFRKTCNWGCDSGLTVTSNSGRKKLSSMFWNDVTIPISLYILYSRGSWKTKKNDGIEFKMLPRFKIKKRRFEYSCLPILKSRLVSSWFFLSETVICSFHIKLKDKDMAFTDRKQEALVTIQSISF